MQDSLSHCLLISNFLTRAKFKDLSVSLLLREWIYTMIKLARIGGWLSRFEIAVGKVPKHLTMDEKMNRYRDTYSLICACQTSHKNGN